MKKAKSALLSLVLFLLQPEFRPMERRVVRALYLAALAWLGYKGVETA